jgi:hypothetical protein
MSHHEFDQLLGSLAGLSPEQIAALRRQLDDLATPVIAVQPANPSNGSAQQPPQRKPLWQRAAELRKSIPEEEWAKLPTDGSEQLDHYIYGSPKRQTS